MKNYYDLIRHRKSTEKIFPCGSAGKESACSVGNLGSIPGLGRSAGEGKGYPLQYSVLENSMNCTVHRVTRVRHDGVIFISLHCYHQYTT